MKTSSGLLLCSLLLIAGCKKSDVSPDSTLQFETEQAAYYRRLSDAPIDLYCIIDSSLSSEDREMLCTHIMMDLSGNLSADLRIKVVEKKITEVTDYYFYFGDDGKKVSDTIVHHAVNDILISLDLANVPTMSSMGDETFGIRIQLERFCIGYVASNGHEVPEIIRKRRKSSE